MYKIERELELIRQYGEDYYNQTMSYLDSLTEMKRYDLFEKCYKHVQIKYNGVIRWEYLFEKTLDAFTKHQFDELIDNIINSDNKNINIDKLCSILLQQNNNYKLNSIYDIDNSSSIKNELLNKIYQNYEKSNDMYVIYEIINKYDIVDKNLTNNVQLLQTLIFQKCFNLNYTEAKSLIDTYGKNISNVKGIDQSLILLINNLKNVLNITDEQKLTEIFKNSLPCDIDVLNYDTIDRILSTSYSNIYNQTNYHPNQKDLIGKVGGNIPVYEIGTEFYMNFYSLGGVFPNNTNEYKNDWDSRRELYISTSFIGNTNMNTCDINNVCYGFCSFKANDVLDVGLKNVFVSNRFINPQSIYRNYMMNSKVINVQYAMPQEFLQESKKEQWNEIGYRRFTEEGKRIYPDYIVYFSDGQINPNDKIWINSVKAATEFSIPIVVINRKRINEYNASVSEQREFVPQQTITFDSTKLSTAMEHFNSVINQKKSGNSNIPNNINTTNESRDNKMEELISQRKELENQLQLLQQRKQSLSDLDAELTVSIMKIENELRNLNDRIKLMQNQQNIDTIRNALGVTFTDSYYGMGGQDINSPPSIIYKTSRQLQMEYMKLLNNLQVKLNNEEITEEQYEMVEHAMTALYNEYKNNAINREKQSQQSKSASSSNNTDDEYNPNKITTEKTDPFESIRIEYRRRFGYDDMADDEKAEFDEKFEKMIELEQKKNQFRKELIDKGIDVDKIDNFDELFQQELNRAQRLEQERLFEEQVENVEHMGRSFR